VIGLDTNVLVRFLTLDDPRQAPRATQIIEHELSEDEPGFVSTVVLAELSWVLESRYGRGRAAIAEVMEGLLRLDCLRFEHPRAVASAVASAVAAAAETNADFAEVLISAIAAEAGCERTLTFDRRALRLPGFVRA
jgi:predicted nucleic-acid-binding protein